jgi:hypothetical protein
VNEPQSEEPTPSKGIAVNVIQTSSGRQAVAISMPDFDQMLVLTPESSRDLAFLLVRCADYINPPFAEEPPSPESLAIFGPYEEEPPKRHWGEDDWDDDDLDEFDPDTDRYGPMV